jgi:hypothetical protein
MADQQKNQGNQNNKDQNRQSDSSRQQGGQSNVNRNTDQGNIGGSNSGNKGKM